MEAFGGRPLVLGHRGARLEAPENTLPSFRRALELGADGVELDVHLTADGKVIVLHDERLERTTDGQGHVNQASLAELRRLDAGSYFSPDFAGTRLCTLSEALDVLSSAALINVELKGADHEELGLEQRALEVIGAANMLNRVVFSSFSRACLERLRRLDGRIALAWLYAWPWERRTAFTLAQDLSLQGLHPNRWAVSKRLVRWAHEGGLRVVSWTVNEQAQVHRFLAWGVDGLITDRPGEVRQWVREGMSTAGQ